MLNIFITAKILAGFICTEAQKLDHERSNMYRIFKNKKYVHLYVGTIDEKSQGKLANFKQMNDFAIDKSKADFIDSIPNQHSRVLEEPNGLYILNISKIDAEDISRKYGVLCFSSDSINESKLIDPNVEYTYNTKECIGDWGIILHSIKGLPSNALIFVDRFLFMNDRPTFANGIQNVFEILRFLLPQEFDKSQIYHVCIVCSTNSKGQKMKLSFQDLAKELNSKMKELAKGYSIDMELIGIPSDSRFYDDTHNRRIISNYFIVRAEHKINALFNQNSSCSQTLTPQRLFTYNCLRSSSAPPLKSIEQTIGMLQALSKILKQEICNGVCCYALNGKQIEKKDLNKDSELHIRNRIIA